LLRCVLRLQSNKITTTTRGVSKGREGGGSFNLSSPQFCGVN
jgi:hypothetical protein